MTRYASPPVGHEMSCVLHSVSKEFLTDGVYVKMLLEEGLGLFHFTVLGNPEPILFPNGAYTLGIILQESHLVVHTYLEHRSMYVHMNSCRGPDDCRGMMEDYLPIVIRPSHVMLISDSQVPITRDAVQR